MSVEPQYTPRSNRVWARRLLRLCLWLLVGCCMLVGVRLPGKWRYYRHTEMARQAMAKFRAVTLRFESKDHLPGGEPPVFTVTVSWSGSSRWQCAGTDPVIEVTDGAQVTRYSPLWKLASTRTLSESDLKFTRLRARNIVLADIGQVPFCFYFWLNPLCVAKTTPEGPSMHLSLSYRSPLARCTDSQETWLDIQSHVPNRVVDKFINEQGEESSTERTVLQFHTSEPRREFQFGVPSGTTLINDAVRTVVDVCEAQGYRVTLFRCSESQRGQLLLGVCLPCRSGHSALVDAVRVRDSSTRADVSDRYHKYWSPWQFGRGGRAELWCFDPKSPSSSLPKVLEITFRVGIFQEYQTRYGGGSRRTATVGFRFPGIRPERYSADSFPPLVEPTWLERPAPHQQGKAKVP